MAQSTKMMPLTAILLVTFKSAIAVEIVVGGDSGWVLPIQANAIGNNYATWADSNNYTVGDSLVFKYDKDVHSVLQVNGAAFSSCNTSDPLGEWKDGNTTILLEKEGRMWFICGTPNHCTRGQKFKITVLANAAPDFIGYTPSPPASATQAGAGKSLFRSSKTALILGSSIAGASYLL